MTEPIERFTVRQKITAMVNRYEIRARDEAGNDGELLAFAQQKRLAFKEEVTFYTDEQRTSAVFSFKARKRIDLAATYDVRDAEGATLGWFRKDFGKSLMRSTWHLGSADGLEATGTERNANVAIARRVWDFVPFADNVPAPFTFHFDFVTADGSIVLSSERKRSLRDRYEIELPTALTGPRLDWRLGAAMAVALDALQGR